MDGSASDATSETPMPMPAAPDPAAETPAPVMPVAATDPICPSQRAIMPVGYTEYLRIACMVFYQDAEPNGEAFYIQPHTYAMHPLTDDTLDQLGADLTSYAKQHFGDRIVSVFVNSWIGVGMSAESIAKRDWRVVPPMAVMKPTVPLA